MGIRFPGILLPQSYICHVGATKLASSHPSFVFLSLSHHYLILLPMIGPFSTSIWWIHSWQLVPFWVLLQRGWPSFCLWGLPKRGSQLILDRTAASPPDSFYVLQKSPVSKSMTISLCLSAEGHHICMRSMLVWIQMELIQPFLVCAPFRWFLRPCLS